MKRLKFHRAIVAIAMMLIGWLPSLAHDFEVNGIYYNILSEEVKKAKVTGLSNDYYGGVIIPESVTFNGKSYSVTTIGAEAFVACSDLYSVYNNTILYNSFVGFIFGLIYMISELPNSFIKRRLDIKAGKTDKGIKGLVFFIIDQIDSLVGVSLLIFLLSNITLWKSVGYVALGAITHITVNIVLYLLKVRKNL